MVDLVELALVAVTRWPAEDDEADAVLAIDVAPFVFAFHGLNPPQTFGASMLALLVVDAG